MKELDWFGGDSKDLFKGVITVGVSLIVLGAGLKIFKDFF
jgi:hypothetical protein